MGFELTPELINAIFGLNMILLVVFAVFIYRYMRDEEKDLKKNG